MERSCAVRLRSPRRELRSARLRLEPEQCLPLPQALRAIRAADIITVGPGSLYTSILPNLLVAQVSRVIGRTNATKIFINNLMTQPGETDGYTARQHSRRSRSTRLRFISIMWS